MRFFEHLLLYQMSAVVILLLLVVDMPLTIIAIIDCVYGPSNDFDILQLPLLPQAPMSIHNLHFKTQVPSECYHELDLPCYDKNKGKRHSENIGKSRVDYA
jgi:hypothetical protein